MPRVDSPEFISWLKEESGIDPDEKPLNNACQSCGVEVGKYPFLRGYCVVCLSFLYGRFVKSQEIAMWIDQNIWPFERGAINDKASAINRLGGERKLPHAKCRSLGG